MRLIPRVVTAAMLATLAGSARGGDPFPAATTLSSLDGVVGFTLNGVALNDQSGRSVSAAGDINGDGVADFVIGASGADPSGSSYVVFGKVASAAGPFPAAFELSGLNGADGFRIDGAAAGDLSGILVAHAGDINGDGVDDLALGTPYAHIGGPFYAGATYVLFGRNTAVAGPFPPTLSLSTINGANGFRLNGVAAYDASGRSVAGAGDINGDGFDDLLISAFGADPGGRSYAGSSYVVFGKDTSASGLFPASMSLASLNGSNGFRLDGALAFDQSGWAVAGAGDINGDGVDDLLIAAPGVDPGGRNYAGSTYVVFGKNTGVAGPFPPSIPLSSISGASGFRIDGALPFDYSGNSTAGARDVNGDGLDDLLIGATGADPGGRSKAGSTYVVFGRDTSAAGPFPDTLNLATLNGTNGFRLDGAAANDGSGSWVAGAGDINADGVRDLLVTAVLADPNGQTDAGSTYVVFGRNAPADGAFPATLALSSLDGDNGFRLDGAHRYDASGRSAACVGDINGDGLDDLLIGAPIADPPGRTNAGASYVLFGRDTRPALCPGDANGDLIVNFADLNIVLSEFGQTGPPGTIAGDINADGVVNFADLNIVLSFFGTAC